MPSEKEVYERHANQYERLILREDYQENIPKEISKIRNPENLDVVEFGAGTGRLTRDLLNTAKSLRACDASLHMLQHAKQIIDRNTNSKSMLFTADMRRTPFIANSADLVIAGWSFCYLAVWGEDRWEENVREGLAEADRLLKPGGTLILLESYGTGTETPDPPPHLLDYLGFLKSNGFQSSWFRTDYQFTSLEEALELSGFFFGEKMTEKVRVNRWDVLPECTAIFWR
jgi:ubiquinone/menaquinone biosynthesis C-methylase UbiE